MKHFLTILITIVTLLASGILFADEAQKLVYAIVVSEKTYDDSQWQSAVKALTQKHSEKFDVKVVKWSKKVTEAKKELSKIQPSYICFVAKWDEANLLFVQSVHILTRALDSDPYTDAIWAILTGYDIGDVNRIIAAKDMVVETLTAGFSNDLNQYTSGVWYSEGTKNEYGIKEKGEKYSTHKDGPDDTTHAIADALGKNQLFMTSGHASPRDWQIGYTYKNGYFFSRDGQLYGRTADKKEFPITHTNSKLYLAVGNCLIGNIDGKDAMALAHIHSAGFNMMMGYVEPTFFGYMGWGVKDYYCGQAGRFTAAQAFFANNQAIVWHINRIFPAYVTTHKFGVQKNQMNMPQIMPKMSEDDIKKFHSMSKKDQEFVFCMGFDLNMVALYGDPAWQNAMIEYDPAWKQELTSKKLENGKTQWTLTITPRHGKDSFNSVCKEDPTTGGRPIIQLLPQRIKDVEIASESESLHAVVTENFILLPKTEAMTTGKPIVLTFTAQ